MDGSQEGEGSREGSRHRETPGPRARTAPERGRRGPENEKPVRGTAQGLGELGAGARRSRLRATGHFGRLSCASVASPVTCAAHVLFPLRLGGSMIRGDARKGVRLRAGGARWPLGAGAVRTRAFVSEDVYLQTAAYTTWWAQNPQGHRRWAETRVKETGKRSLISLFRV